MIEHKTEISAVPVHHCATDLASPLTVTCGIQQWSCQASSDK